MTQLFTLITGASSGIGQGIAKKLSSTRNLILHGRNKDRLESTRQECINCNNHFIWNMDFSNVEQIHDGLIKFIADNSVKIDCFIHSAGIVKVLPIRVLDYPASKEILDVNFFSGSEIVRVLVKKRVNEACLKNILFISSIWSNFGEKGHSMYCASKGALDSFMRALAVELAPTVRVNSVLAGGVKTPMSEKAFADPKIMEKYHENYLLGIGQIEDIAESVEFLISDKARWITGQQFIVDGGKTAH